HDDKTKKEAKGKSPVESLTGYRNLSAEFEIFSDNSINKDNVAGTLVSAVVQISPNSTNTFSAASLTQGKSSYVYSSQLLDEHNMPKLEDITYSDDEVGAEADFNNLETSITVSLTQGKSSYVYSSQLPDEHNMPKLEDITYSDDEVGAEADFNNLETSITVRNKKDERDIVVMNKARLVTQGHTQEEWIDYEEVFALVVRIEAIRLFLAYASFMGFMVYQMDVKSAFLYGTIEERYMFVNL
nr:putative ribonuclease H-like domain-containing protein [Tanacetum cinerariifolium]